MLQTMRQWAHSWPVKGLMLFLIVSFSLWGISDIFRGNPLQKTVAKAGDSVISVQELNRMFEQSLSAARRGADAELTAAQAKRIGVLDKTLENAIKRLLVDQDIKKLGIDVPPQAVLKLVSDQPQFRTKDGHFNKELFQQLLQQQGLNEQSFIAQGQQDLSRQILIESLAGSRVAPQSEIDAIYQARARKRILDIVTVESAKMTGIGAPDDKTLRDFYDKNQALFTAPEYRGLTIAVLSTDNLTRDIAVSDDQVKKEYDARGDQLSNPEQRDLTQVVVQDEAKAGQLAAQARAKGDLAAAAKVLGESAVPLDHIDSKNLLPELAEPAFALAQGQIGDPVKTQLGWHVIQVKKIIPAGKPDFAAVKEKLRADMQRDQAVETATRSVNQLDDQLAAGHSLNDIADGQKLRLIKIAAVDAAGLTPDGKEPTELPDREQVLKSAFNQNAGETGPIQDDKAGTYFIVRTDSVTPAAPRPFDIAKPMIAAMWKSHQQLDKAQAQADKIAAGLRAGQPASSFMSADGVGVRTSTPISLLGDSDALLTPDIMAQAMRLKKGEVASMPSDRNQIVIRVAQIVDADPATKDPRKNMIDGEVKQAAGGELLDQYIAHLYTVFPVKIDNALVDQLRGQGN